MAAIIEVKYFNSFMLRKTVNSSGAPVWKGASDATSNSTKNWIVEESRIRGGYNNTSVDFGVKAYLAAEGNTGSILSNSLIYSGILNSRTGVNNTNQFPVGEEITRSLDPSNGSIQKLHAENTNLTILQENKVSKALIDKDAIYSAEGKSITTSGAQVIGQIVPYAGEYGISKDPGSFAVYGYRKYFTDKNRNAVLRLSSDGITEISAYGMKDFFRDKFDEIDLNSFNLGKVIGGFDVHTKTYVVSLQNNNNVDYDTLAFDESVKGWVSRYSYKPDQIFSLKNNYFTTFSGGAENFNGLYKHYFGSEYGKFYGVNVDSSVTTVFNPKVSLSKNFLTIGYEGSNGWEMNDFRSDFTGVDNGINFDDVTFPVKSYDEGEFVINPATGQPVRPADYQATFGTPYPPYNKMRAGFNRKENKYVSNLKNNSMPRPGEIVYAQSLSGVKGMFATVVFSIDSTTNITGKKELFAVSSTYVESSY
tara:strand:+ start:1586 stop:3016 length:1431 start_codon:yes stop_codon:yes gene_type:complete